MDLFWPVAGQLASSLILVLSHHAVVQGRRSHSKLLQLNFLRLLTLYVFTYKNFVIILLLNSVHFIRILISRFSEFVWLRIYIICWTFKQLNWTFKFHVRLNIFFENHNWLLAFQERFCYVQLSFSSIIRVINPFFKSFTEILVPSLIATFFYLSLFISLRYLALLLFNLMLATSSYSFDSFHMEIGR